jgi:hypothetical protein
VGGSSSRCKFFGLIFDTLLSWAFFVLLINYIFTEKFEKQSDKTMLLLIGPCFTGTFLIYTIFDAIRYLPYWSDKFLYTVSCILQKPILLPILLSGSFRSYTAVRASSGKVIAVRGKYSRTLSSLGVSNDEVFQVNGIKET